MVPRIELSIVSHTKPALTWRPNPFGPLTSLKRVWHAPTNGRDWPWAYPILLTLRGLPGGFAYFLLVTIRRGRFPASYLLGPRKMFYDKMSFPSSPSHRESNDGWRFAKYSTAPITRPHLTAFALGIRLLARVDVPSNTLITWLRITRSSGFQRTGATPRSGHSLRGYANLKTWDFNLEIILGPPPTPPTYHST